MYYYYYYIFILINLSLVCVYIYIKKIQNFLVNACRRTKILAQSAHTPLKKHPVPTPSHSPTRNYSQFFQCFFFYIDTVEEACRCM